MGKVDTNLSTKFGLPQTTLLTNDLPAVEHTTDDVSTPYDATIQSIQRSIEVASGSMNMSSAVADSNEEARSYEAYAATARALSDLYTKLLDAINARQKYLADLKTVSGPQTQITNNTLILTPADMIKQLKPQLRLLKE